MSTRARAPLFSAIIRFWMSVDSLKRPPTLLTICSSFRSSCMLAPGKGLDQNAVDFRHSVVHVVVENLVVVFVLLGEFLEPVGHAALDGFLALRPALA